MINMLALSSPITVVFAISSLHEPLNQDFQRKKCSMSVKSRIFFPFFSIHTDKFPGKLHQHFYRLSFGTGSSLTFTEKYRVPISFKISLHFPEEILLLFQHYHLQDLWFLSGKSGKSRFAKLSQLPSKSPATLLHE